MQQWEYLTVRSDDPETIQQYGEEGWELVSAFPIANNPAFPAKKSVAARPGMTAARNSIIGIVLVLSFFVCFFTVTMRGSAGNEIPISQAVADIRAGRVTEIVVREDSNKIYVLYGPGGEVKTAIKEPDGTIQSYLLEAGVTPSQVPSIRVESASSWGQYLSILGYCFPSLLLVAILFVLVRQGIRQKSSTELLLIFMRPKIASQDS